LANELKVRIEVVVVVDPRGNTALLAIMPISQRAACLTEQPRRSWGTLAAWTGGSPLFIDELVGLGRTNAVMTLRRHRSGVSLAGDGGDLALLFTEPPRGVDA
jgi:hypothetical protein